MTENLIEKITGSLLASYANTYQPKTRLPEQDRVIEILSDISRLLFPGYYTRQAPTEESHRYQLSAWLCDLRKHLTNVLVRSLSYPNSVTNESREEARRIATEFIAALPQFRAVLLEDADAALLGDPAASSVDEVILTYPGFRAITTYRLAHWFYTQSIPILPRIMTEYAHSLTGIDIHPGAKIGARFFIDHGTGVVVGESTVIGNDVKLYQGVTLGAHSVDRNLAGNKRHPTLEDGVVIYAGATVLGGDTVIGESSVIGGNVWLTHSVSPKTMVLATPASLAFKPMPPASDSAL